MCEQTVSQAKCSHRSDYNYRYWQLYHWIKLKLRYGWFEKWALPSNIWMVFWATILNCKAMLGWGYPGLMGWILLWIIPLVYDQSFELLTRSSACYHCITDAPLGNIFEGHTATQESLNDAKRRAFHVEYFALWNENEMTCMNERQELSEKTRPRQSRVKIK